MYNNYVFCSHMATIMKLILTVHHQVREIPTSFPGPKKHPYMWTVGGLLLLQ